MRGAAVCAGALLLCFTPAYGSSAASQARPGRAAGRKLPQQGGSAALPLPHKGVGRRTPLAVVGGGVGQQDSRVGVAAKEGQQPQAIEEERRDEDGGGVKREGVARIGVGSGGEGGLGMDLDVDVEKLKGAIGKVAGPLVVLLNVVQASIFYAAPMLALVQFIKELRRPRKPHPPHSHTVSSSSSSSAVATASPRSYPYAVESAAPYHQHEQHERYYSVPSGVTVTALPPGLERPDVGAFFGLTGRALAQWSVLTLLLAGAGRVVQSLADSSKVGPDSPLVSAADLAVSGLAVFCSDWIGFLDFRMDMEWYRFVLKKPSWTPPPIAFPLIWTPLKLLQTASLVLVWRAVRRQALSMPVSIFSLHLVLGTLWNRVFFGEKRVGFGLSVIWAFYAALAASAYAFLTVSPAAGYLLMPTAVWVFIAVSLQFSIWLLNGQESIFPVTAGAKRKPAPPEASPPLILNL